MPRCGRWCAPRSSPRARPRPPWCCPVGPRWVYTSSPPSRHATLIGTTGRDRPEKWTRVLARLIAPPRTAATPPVICKPDRVILIVSPYSGWMPGRSAERADEREPGVMSLLRGADSEGPQVGPQIPIRPLQSPQQQRHQAARFGGHGDRDSKHGSRSVPGAGDLRRPAQALLRASADRWASSDTTSVSASQPPLPAGSGSRSRHVRRRCFVWPAAGRRFAGGEIRARRSSADPVCTAATVSR
jgi:hypothetical protein